MKRLGDIKKIHSRAGAWFSTRIGVWICACLGGARGIHSRLGTWFSLFWFYVRSNVLLARLFAVFLALLWTAAFFAGGYYYSERRFDDLLVSFEQMSKHYNIPYEDLSWAARFAALKRWVEVSDKAFEEVKVHLYNKDSQIKELEEQLYFYRTVVAPEDSKKRLSIFEVGLRRAAEGETYSIEVVLRNHGRKKTTVKGRVKVLVEGTAEQLGEAGSGGALVRDDLLEEEIRFSFKYFQRLRGILRLPERFSPSRLTVAVDAGRNEGIEATYAWAGLLEKSE